MTVTAAQADGKLLTKEQVGYTYMGRPQAHCGPCREWPGVSGSCKSFEGPDNCKLVAGYISPSGWCRRFERRWMR